MVRPIAKKRKTQKENKEAVPVGAQSTASQASDSSPNHPFVKLLVLVVAILAFLYGPSLFKGLFQGGLKQGLQEGFQSTPKLFLVKKVAQFTGTETQGKPFFANDIVAVAAHELAITDNLNGQALLYDFKGKLLRKVGKNGTGPKEFHEPSGIATDRKGHFFVMDSLNDAIKTFDLEGNLLRNLDLNHLQVFPGPRKIGWGGDCFLIFNGGDARLNRVSVKGELLGTWGEQGAGKGGFWGVSSAIVDDKGDIYAGDMNLKESRVRVFDKSGKVIQEIKPGIAPDDFALDSKGRLFVAGYGDSIKVFDSKGDWLGTLADEAETTTPINMVAGIDILSSGLILTCGGDVITIYQIIDQEKK